MNFLVSSSGSVLTSCASNLRTCISCLNIFFMSIFGGFGFKEYIEPRESSAVPYPLYAGIAWYVTLGLAFASFRGFYSTPIFFVYHYLVKSSQS